MSEDKSRLLTADALKSLLHYSKESGAFRWRSSRSGIRSDGTAGSRHNRGYLAIRIVGRSYLCHRLAWLYVHGRWPSHQLDHINGVRDDNRIANLRECTNAQNCQNARPHADGSGKLGTTWEKRRRKWQAGIGLNGKRIFLGYFATQQEAHAAYLSAKQRLHVAFGASNG